MVGSRHRSMDRNFKLTSNAYDFVFKIAQEENLFCLYITSSSVVTRKLNNRSRLLLPGKGDYQERTARWQ